jgi:5-bromo-4-chloroindolyl phosphate hydrolysis protein
MDLASRFILVYIAILKILASTGHALIMILRAVVMTRFLEILNTKYGGARGYFKEYSSLTDEELDIIRNSLVVSKKE